MTSAQRVASWAKKAHDATLRRDAAIRQMRAEGATLRSIALAADMTHTGVARVLGRMAQNEKSRSE